MNQLKNQPNIFKAYDIRGIFGVELDVKTAYRIGRAVAVFSNAREILIGRDMRTSSNALHDSLVRGLLEQGCNVTDIGLCSTPLFYWATQTYEAGIMITASHNPAQYNGFKICRSGAQPVGEQSGMKEIEQLFYSGDFPESRSHGKYVETDVVDDYVRFNLTFLKTNKPFTVVIDAGNGMGGYTYGRLLRKIPSNIRIIPMFFELDGTFPNHEADPLKTENLKLLQKRVIREKADLGVGLDGDGDRIAFVDDKGVYLPNDFTTALIAGEILTEKRGATILYDIRQSRVTPETILAAGGKPVMTRVGHAFIKAAMREHHAAWGGELSGHFYNAEVQNCENTQIVFFRMLNLLAKKKLFLSRLTAPLRKRYAKIEETNFKVKDAKAILQSLDEEYSSNALGVSHLDGLRVDFEDWWFNVRPSNTEPLVRLNMEAKTPELLERQFEILKKRITSGTGFEGNRVEKKKQRD